MSLVNYTLNQLAYAENRINRATGGYNRLYINSNLKMFKEENGAYLTVVCSPSVIHVIFINKKFQLIFHNHKTSDLQTLINIGILQKENSKDKLDLCGCAQIYFLILSKFWEKYTYGYARSEYTSSIFKRITSANNLSIIAGYLVEIIQGIKQVKTGLKIFEKPRVTGAVSVTKGFKENLIDKYNNQPGTKPYLAGYIRSFKPSGRKKIGGVSIQYKLDINEVETIVDGRELTINLPYYYYIKFHKQGRSLIKNQLVLSIEKELSDGRYICKVLKKLKGPYVSKEYALVEFSTQYLKFLTEDEANNYLTFNKKLRKPRSKKSLDIQAYMQSINNEEDNTEDKDEF